jgi:hypothetical protein
MTIVAFANHKYLLHRNLKRMFHPVNSLVITRNQWVISSLKFGILLILWNQLQSLFFNSKDSKFVLIISWFNRCWIISNFVIFHKIKVAKHIWDPCCHLPADTASWFILTEILILILISLPALLTKLDQGAMFVKRLVGYSAFFTYLVGWHNSVVSLPPCDFILAKQACPPEWHRVLFTFRSNSL